MNAKARRVRHDPDLCVDCKHRRHAVDDYLSNVESLLTALEQRELDGEQVERLARLLQRGEILALARSKNPNRRRGRAA